MANSNALHAYLTQSVMTASPARLVAMLYDRAISSLKEAVRAIEAGEIEARWRANNRAVEIVSHLAMTLDLEQGGEIANNLSQLYRFMLLRLLQVDLHNDTRAAREVIGLLEPLRSSWHELADRGAVNVPAKPVEAAATSLEHGNCEPADQRISVSA